MNEMYSDVRERLRQQHLCNIQEITKSGYFNKSGYYDKNEVQEENKRKTSWTFSFKAKVFLLISCIMLFSCYLYGGQDVKKGAVMAFNEMNVQITELEEDSLVVKRAVSGIKTIYNDAKDFFKTYFNVD